MNLPWNIHKPFTGCRLPTSLVSNAIELISRFSVKKWHVEQFPRETREVKKQQCFASSDIAFCEDASQNTHERKIPLVEVSNEKEEQMPWQEGEVKKNEGITKDRVGGCVYYLDAGTTQVTKHPRSPMYDVCFSSLSKFICAQRKMSSKL